MAESGAPAQRSYRSNNTNGIAAFFLLAGLLVIAGGIGALVDPHKDAPVGAVGVIVGAFAIAYALGVVARMGVTADKKGVVVRNWVRWRFVKWADIGGFSFGSDLESLTLREMLSTPMLATYMRLADGRHVALSGLSATRVNRSKSRAKVQSLLDELESQRQFFTGQ